MMQELNVKYISNNIESFLQQSVSALVSVIQIISENSNAKLDQEYMAVSNHV